MSRRPFPGTLWDTCGVSVAGVEAGDGRWRSVCPALSLGEVQTALLSSLLHTGVPSDLFHQRKILRLRNKPENHGAAASKLASEVRRPGRCCRSRHLPSWGLRAGR